MGGELSELAKSLLLNNTGQLERMLREAAQNAISRIFSVRFRKAICQCLSSNVRVWSADARASQSERSYQQAGLSPEQIEKLMAYIDRRLYDLAHMVRSFSELNWKKDPQVREQQNAESRG
jgi:hypothetical protein